MSDLEFEITSIPSLVEIAPVVLDRSTNQLVKGLKIKFSNRFYIVGELAANEGTMPYKEINSSPESTDYNVLLNASLLVANYKIGNPMIVTTGFPFATFRGNREAALLKLVKDHIVEYDSSTFSNSSVKKMVVEVKSAEILPEVQAASLAVRELEKPKGDFFMLSLGFGTFETFFSTENGEFSTQRAGSSAPGILYAINLLKNELGALQNVGMENEYYYDQALQNGFIFLNRKKNDISEIRAKVLETYYESVISPHLKRTFTDKEFSKSKAIYLSGGGALYPELVEKFKEEFRDLLEVIIPENPNHLAVKGYCINSKKIAGGNERQSVGIDLGNSSTLICTIKPNTAF
jgi:plasmid segregation protein ParM